MKNEMAENIRPDLIYVAAKEMNSTFINKFLS